MSSLAFKKKFLIPSLITGNSHYVGKLVYTKENIILAAM